MGQFVGHHPLQFLGSENAQDTFRSGNRGVARVAAGGEGVGGILRDDIDAGHGKTGLSGETPHHSEERGVVIFADFSGAVHLQDNLVGKPVGKEVHGAGHEEGEDHAGLAAEGTPHEYHENGEE